MTATPAYSPHVLPEFRITREFPVARDQVWTAMTAPDAMREWMAPEGSAMNFLRWEFHPGGVSHYCVRSADGQESWGRSAYRSIREPEELVFVNAFSGPDGGVSRHPLSATWPLELLTTMTFAEAGRRTRLTISWRPINATLQEMETFANSFAACERGWTGQLDQLQSYLEESRQVRP